MTRRTRIAAASLALLVVGVLASAQLGACTGSRPADIGLHEGRLRACPDSPNCVSSFEPARDEEHHEPSIDRIVDRTTAMTTLRALLGDTPRAEVVVAKDDYLHVEFQSLVFRFVDDVELYLPADEPVIHFRSASRLGSSDLGANRSRIRDLGSRYRAAVAP